MQLPWKSTSFAKHNFLLLQSFFLHSTGDNKLHVYDSSFCGDNNRNLSLRNPQQLVLMQEKTQQKIAKKDRKIVSLILQN